MTLATASRDPSQQRLNPDLTLAFNRHSFYIVSLTQLHTVVIGVGSVCIYVYVSLGLLGSFGNGRNFD